MHEDIFFEIHHNLLREGPGRDKYTKKAFQMIPPIKNPTILDIGCGPGTPTVLIAKLSYGHVIGIDTHQPYLDELEKKAEEVNLSHKIKTLNCSMLNMDFPSENFLVDAEKSDTRGYDPRDPIFINGNDILFSFGIGYNYNIK